MVIHSGGCGGGHYYSYIKVKNGLKGKKDTWLEFNDTRVSEFNYSNLAQSCFGGKTKKGGDYGWGGGENSTSAYMLIYERDFKTKLNFVINN